MSAEFYKYLVRALRTSVASYQALLHGEMKAMRRAKATSRDHASHVT
jgi:hypothetical protein